MSFEAFLDVLIETPFKKYDVHVLPQSQLICIGHQIVPKFVGRVEQIDEHWAELARSWPDVESMLWSLCHKKCEPQQSQRLQELLQQRCTHRKNDADLR